MSRFKTFGLVVAVGLVGIEAMTAWAQQNQANNAQAGNAGGNGQGGFNGGIQQMPWFSNPSIRQQLQLNDEQFKQLNQSYMQSWERYNKGLADLDRNLNEQQRMQRLQEMNGLFQKDFSKSVDEAFADRAARQRYNQMEWQYRGYGAFNDPALQQQLQLNDEQRQRFARYQNEWNDQLRTWQMEFAKDREGVANRYRESRRELRERINATLTPEQRKMWTDMGGKPYEFPVDVYFQGNTNSNSNPTSSK